MTKTRRSFGAIRQLPSGRWQAKYRDPRTNKLTPAPRTFAIKAQAEQWLTTVEADLLRDEITRPKVDAPRDVTVDAWAEEWLGLKRAKRATTIDRDRYALAYAKPVIGETIVRDVRPAHIAKIVEDMEELAPSTIRRNVNVLAAMFSAAEEADLTDRSPVRRRLLDLPTVTHRERPMIEPSQLMTLAEKVDRRYRALVLVGGVLGTRWGETVGLRVCDVNFLHRQITIAGVVEEIKGNLRWVPLTKTIASARTFTVPAFLVDELELHLEEHRTGAGPTDLIFVGPRGGILRRHWLARDFKPAVKAAGLPDGLNFHGLRHVAATLLVDAKVHPRVIQGRHGHADPKMSMGLYAHKPDRADREAADSLDALFVPAKSDEPIAESVKPRQ